MTHTPRRWLGSVALLLTVSAMALPAGASAVGNDSAQTQPSASISGTVTTADGNPHQVGLEVWLVNRATRQTRITWATPTYSFQDVPSGTYDVEFSRDGSDEDYGGNVPYAGEYYDDVHERPGASPTLVTLAPGEARTGIDAVLEVGGTISGRVVDPAGRPLAHCTVRAGFESSGVTQHIASTDSTGAFSISGVSTAPYDLVVGLDDPQGPACRSGLLYYAGGQVLSTRKSSARVAAALGADTSLGTLKYTKVGQKFFDYRGEPRVRGTARVGRRLAYGKELLSPAATAHRFTWLRDGRTIRRATRASYELRRRDRGHRISLRVVCLRSGYETETLVTASTSKVRRR